ncbi:hypothetical protein L861_10075 [Litchfieldella anticariensis FP35 = DSM 16096]|uniref:CDP-alcohol phosphatidyltransferase n=1 Tax=Litchfieldella anticariensis (strain DSM 16096 / CECT 5854 / CIP 108499 / LMG 22089 / FP35) TaxID=1121939 RepID=S2KKJ6_LITA3|nr:CDP-alcohol phosphatidyltransferase family protein [Halomonas anticariensis]EPC02682.1 hypothetical protein L861_10075 [Halomonas anticariensis FP35 = DSM 16096]
MDEPSSPTRTANRLLAFAHTRPWHGWANRITLLRALLVMMIAATLPFPEFMASQSISLASLAFVALLLDGLDGWVARRTGMISAFGARFDMEVDAIFILVLCAVLMVLDKVGAWVLAIGAMRYVFIIAGWHWDWLRAELPDSRRRKAICVWQVTTLLICLLPIVGHAQASLLSGMALLLLSASFAMDVRWLRGNAD